MRAGKCHLNSVVVCRNRHFYLADTAVHTQPAAFNDFSQSAICMNIQLSEYEEPTFIFIFETPLSATIRSLGVHNGVA